jgi:PAS domain S-box-containing protein
MAGGQIFSSLRLAESEETPIHLTFTSVLFVFFKIIVRSPGTSRGQAPLPQGSTPRPARPSQKFPLRMVLVLPFVLEIVTAVGLTGYFSYRNGQQTVNKLATQLMQEEGDRFYHRLNDYLKIPPQVFQLTEDVIAMDMLHLSDLRRTGQYFLKQHQLFPELNYIGFDNLNGDRVGTYQLNNRPVIELLQKSKNQGIAIYTADASGKPAQLMQKKTGYLLEDSTQNTKADLAKRSTWHEISYQPTNQKLTISFKQLLYNRDRRLLGVLRIHTDLLQISHLLNQLKLNKINTVFVIDRSGLLVASSSDYPSFKLRKGRVHRLQAVDSADEQLAEVARYVSQQPGGIQNIQGPQQLNFSVQGEPHFVQITPYKNRTVDWLIVAAVPESSFMAEIHRNNRNTILLCGGALVGAIALGLLTAQWIAKPILRLSRASRALTLGEWDYPVEENSRIAELEVLAHSFNQMTEQLQQTFDQVKTALQESKEKFTKIFHNSPDIVNIVTIPDATYLEVNESFLEATGYARAEVIGRTAFELKLIANLEQVQHLQHLVEINQEIRNVEFDFCTKSGQIRNALLSCEVIELEGQQCILSVSRDITDRKQLEVALQRSEAKLRDVLNSATVGICSFRLYTDESLQYEYFSAGHALIYGYTAEEMMADTALWHSRVHPEDLKNVIFPAYKRLSKHHSSSIEYRFLHKDGTLRWISDYLTAHWDEIADCWIITAAAVDRTARKQLEIALQDSETKLNDVLNTAIASIKRFRLNADRTREVDFWSRGCEAVFGYSTEELLANPTFWEERVLPEDMQHVLKPLQERLLTEQRITCEYRFQHRNGMQRWISSTYSSRRDDALDCWFVTAVETDITANKQVARSLHQSYCSLSQRNEELAVVNEELQKTLEELRVAEEELRQQNQRLKSERQRYQGLFNFAPDGCLITDAVGIIQEANEAIAAWLQFNPKALIGRPLSDFIAGADLKTFSEYLSYVRSDQPVQICDINLQPPDASLLPTEITVAPVCDLAGKLIGLRWLIRNISDRKQLKEALNESEASKYQILQAIPDLIILMTMDGICLDVIDGSGITSSIPKSTAIGKNQYDLLPTEVAQQRKNAVQQAVQTGETQVYEQQLTISAATRYEEVRIIAVGIDRILVMIRDITDRKQSEVQSQIGVGTTVELELPVHPVDGGGLTTGTIRRVVGLVPGQPKFRILVVDEVPASRMLLVDLLSAVGFEVQSAANGQAALDAWERDLPDLIWMDLRLPGMSGQEVIQWIRAEEALSDVRPHSQSTVIIAISASPLEVDRQHALAAGCNDFVSKPDSEAIVFEKISQFLGVEYLYEGSSGYLMGDGHSGCVFESARSNFARRCDAD